MIIPSDTHLDLDSATELMMSVAVLQWDPVNQNNATRWWHEYSRNSITEEPSRRYTKANNI